jgi:predicted PhzF superfamily epimerase YddE/YHI9
VGADGVIEMDLPASAPAPVADPPDWSMALGVGANRIVDVWSDGHWPLVELAEPADVRACVPDRGAVLELGGLVIATAAPGDAAGVDAVSRVFGPGVGIDEDPVTGAAHCVIGPWLAALTGRTDFVGHQASARGGVVGMHVAGDRVTLRGRAVTVLEGTLQSDPPPA